MIGRDISANDYKYFGAGQKPCHAEEWIAKLKAVNFVR